MLVAGGWHWGETLSANDVLYRRATTACLSAIVLMQIVNVQLCRSHRQSLVALPPFGNRLVVAGMLLEIVLITLIGYTAVGNRLFGTASINWRAWAIVLPFAIGMLAAEEARKGHRDLAESGRSGG